MSARPRARLVVLLLALVPTAASAQAPMQAPVALDRVASDGVDRPIKDYSGQGDASSIELNPALLSGVKGLDVVLQGYRSTSPFTRGTGVGGFLSLNLGLGFATGVAVQRVSPGFRGGYIDVEGARNPTFTKVSFAFAGGDGRFGSIGLGVHWLLGPGQIRRPDLDLGLMLRVRNWASLGAVARLAPADLTATAGLPQELSVLGELAIRPLGTRALELAGGLRTRWRADANVAPQSFSEFVGVFPRGRLAVRHQGLEIAGEVEQVAATLLNPTTYEITDRVKRIRGGVSLAVAWDLVSVRAGMHAGLSEGVDGFGIAARFSTAKQGRVFWPRLVDAERIDIAAIQGERALIRTLERIERAEKAGERAILLVDARATKLGWASLQELRAALVRVRGAGGHVFAYLEDGALKDYYLASVAEHIYIHPAGELATYGLAATTMYYKGALDKIGVQAEGLHIAEYKSAHEPFTRTGPSDSDKAQRDAILDDTYTTVLGDVAQARGLTVADARALLDDAPHGPDQALRRKLVDKVVFRDEVIESISNAIGAKVRFARFEDTAPEPQTWSVAPYVAVVLVEGTIVDGESRTIPILNLQFAGGDTILEQLRVLRRDAMCKGIVLRVNSPGGSALASDLIWREVQRTHDAHLKDPRRSPPITVSMGDVAGSGGYYVAMGAPTIFAQPTTLTGSIGVVSLHFDLSGLLGKLGISTHTFMRGKNADIGSLYKPYTDDQRARMDASMRRIYDLFRKRVADNRKLTMDQVDQLGRGHVYSGIDAKELRLVDQFGGLHEAIADVRSRAGVKPRADLDIRVFPRQRRLVDLLLEAVTPESGDKGLRARITARRAAKDPLPLALTAALARLPLSLLFLPPDQALALLPGTVEIE
jgi:protease-4